MQRTDPLTRRRFLIDRNFKYHQCVSVTCLFIPFRKAVVHVDPTALPRLSTEVDRDRPSCNNTAKHSSSSWTFNKTLSNLIRFFSPLSTMMIKVFPSIKLLSLSWLVYIFCFSQKEYSEIPRPGERHLDSEGHAETGRYHPLCVWSPQHHEHLRKSLPSLANCVPHEEPTSQALCHCGKLWDPAEQQLRTWDWLSRLCYQVVCFPLKRHEWLQRTKVFHL